MKHIKVFAPGTVANLGCGFDIMGLTLDGVGDRIEVAAEAGASGLAIRNESGKRLPEKPEDNVITPAVAALLEAYGKPVRVEITILEKIAPGSGIGSSAASSAAAVYGLNELLGRPFSAERLVEFAMMGEALIGGTPHADNVGPALLGGVVLIRGYGPLDIIRLPVPDAFSTPWRIPTSWSALRRRARCCPARFRWRMPSRSGATSADLSPDWRWATWR